MLNTIYVSDARSQFRAIDQTLVRPALRRNLQEAMLTHNQALAVPPPKVLRHGQYVEDHHARDYVAQARLTDAAVRVEALEGALEDIDAFETDLTMLGLPPIAMLPRGLWHHLTWQAQVYRFENMNKHGTVPAQHLGKYTNLKLRLGAMTMRELVAKLWPHCHDTIREGIRVTPCFPQAPERFEQNVHQLKQTRYPVYIAAAPEAITVSRKEVLEQHLRMDINPPPPRPGDDPILYTTDATGGWIAILDYFGHFPKEEELVQMARDWYASRQQSRRT